MTFSKSLKSCMIMLSSLAVVVGQYSIHSAVEDLLSNQKNEHFTPIMLFYLTRFRYGTCSSLTPSRLARSPHRFYQAIVVNCATAALRHRSAVRDNVATRGRPPRGGD